jgi:hypothetical protein
VADLAWTAVGGNVAYTLAGASVAVSIGPISVTFSCEVDQPAAPIVTTVVLGTSGLKAAPATEVVGTQESLARTGADVLFPLATAVALVDLGYLALSATRPAHRPRRSG